jgi:hypothetical protein
MGGSSINRRQASMKNIINWNYERASWQWDVLCIVIMCFIFLTPKSWFEGNGPAANQTLPAPVKAEGQR